MYNITKDGKPLDESLYEIDKKNKTFSSKEDNLVLNFDGLDGWSFNMGSGCTFNTGDGCIFDTGPDCTFNAGSSCTFNAGSSCTFDTLWNCIFNTEEDCTFKVGVGCAFHTLWNCIFETGSDCTFNIFSDFNKIKTGGNSSVIMRDKSKGVYLKEDEIELYFENNEILYTKNKLTKDNYLMMKELRK